MIRIPKKCKWSLPKQAYLSAYHYALEYSEWKDKHDSICGLRAVAQDGQPHGTTAGNPTEAQGMELASLEAKMKMIEDICMDVAPWMYKWLLKGVTNEGITYTYLKNIMGIPCSYNLYYEKRREFFYRLHMRLEKVR